MDTLKDKAKELIDLKNQIENLKEKYEEKRIEVYNELINENKEKIEVDGYEIKVIKSINVRKISVDELIDVLRDMGFSDDKIYDIIFQSKKEITLNRFLIIRRKS